MFINNVALWRSRRLLPSYPGTSKVEILIPNSATIIVLDNKFASFYIYPRFTTLRRIGCGRACNKVQCYCPIYLKFGCRPRGPYPHVPIKHRFSLHGNTLAAAAKFGIIGIPGMGINIIGIGGESRFPSEDGQLTSGSCGPYPHAP